MERKTHAPVRDWRTATLSLFVAAVILAAAPGGLGNPAGGAEAASPGPVGLARSVWLQTTGTPEATEVMSATPTPEASPSPEPTAGHDEHVDGTPTVEASPTTPQSPTETPAAAAAAEAGIPGDPYPEAPLCQDHDPRTYHGLWNAEEGCHYDHHHGDNPHDVDDIFGTEYYDWAGGSISYPWETAHSQTGCTENDCKHTGYVWLVRRDQRCYSQYTNGCVVAFRAQVHAMASAHDTSVRYHSAWFEAKVCREDRPSVCGIFRGGGWQDTGDLLIDNRRVIDYPNSFNRIKIHSLRGGNSHFGTWYSGSPGGEEKGGGLWFVAVGIGDMWGPLDPADPHRVQFYCEDPTDHCRWNGSQYQPHDLAVGFPPRFRAIVDPDRDGVAEYDGYTDRYGLPVSGCTEVGLDCVPLVFENIPVAYRYQGRYEYREYDVLFDGQTSGWLQFPD